MRREEAETAAEGVFVVVVVVADKESGGNERWRGQARKLTPSRTLLPFGEGKMAVLAALAAVTVAL